MQKRALVNKRAQITVFIIIGIIILLAVGSAIYIRTIVVKRALPPVAPALVKIPLELRPIREYTEDCIEIRATEALNLIGEHGGYIEPSDWGILSDSLNPTESNAMAFFDTDIPYWFYLKSSNQATDYVFDSLTLPLESIESQINDYVKAELPSCLNRYLAFSDLAYTVEEKGEIIPTTTITREDVRVYIEYPLEIRKGDFIGDISKFNVIIPLNFRRVYEFAENITQNEMTYSFLEYHTLNLIGVFSSLDEDGIPPTTEMAFDFSSPSWAKREVAEKTSQMVGSYIPGLQVFDTENYRRRTFPGDDVAQGFYNSFDLATNLDERFSDLEVRFDYLEWPMYFGGDETIRSESLGGLLDIIPIQRPEHLYDISFPTLITIDDPEALNGRGYKFLFALEANIRNNEPVDTAFAEMQDLGFNTFEEDLFCTPGHFTSENVTVTVIDSNTQEPIPDMQVSFTCGASCVVGVTNDSGILKSQFPVCPGIVSFASANYYAPVHILTTSIDKEEEIKAEAWSFITKDIRIEKITYDLALNQPVPYPANLADDENAFITLTKIRQTRTEEEVIAVTDYYGNQTEPSTLRLVPGKYEVEIYGFVEKAVIIDDKITWREHGERKHKDIHMEFDPPFQLGGVKLNPRTTGYFEIKPDDLYKDNEIVFYMVAFSTPTKLSHLDEITKVEEYSGKANMKSLLIPKYEQK